VKDFENLVSIQELQQQISASKLFNIFLSKEQRKRRMGLSHSCRLFTSFLL